MMKVFLSLEAQAQLQQLCDYLETEWSESVCDQFLEKLDARIKIISQFPYSFPTTKKNLSIHKCVVTNQNIVFYKIHKNEIEIITIRDSRQKPIF